MWQRWNTWAAVMWGLRRQIGEPPRCSCTPCDSSATTWRRNNDRSAPTQCSRAGDQSGPRRSRMDPAWHRTRVEKQGQGGGMKRQATWAPTCMEATHTCISTAKKCQILAGNRPSGCINYKSGSIKAHRNSLTTVQSRMEKCAKKTANKYFRWNLSREKRINTEETMLSKNHKWKNVNIFFTITKID